MRKVGILTFQFAHNYGALLQAYALKTTIENMGIKTEIINFCPKELEDSYSMNPLVLIQRDEYGKIKNIPWRIKQAQLFHKFQNKVLQLGEKLYDLNNNLVKQFDVIIVGSDQVWNPDIVPNVENYLLNNIDVNTKISYAASIGGRTLDKRFEDVFINSLRKFSIVSMREKNSIDFIQRAGIKVYHALDPVFLFRRHEWRNFYINKAKIKHPDKYILYIDLMNDLSLKKILKEVIDNTKLPAFAIHPTAWKMNISGVKQLYSVGPFEYLELIDKASYIVSNSFHGVAFSYIFKKKLYYSLDSKLNNRIEDFLSFLGLKCRDCYFDFQNYPDINIMEIEGMGNLLSQIKICIQRGR